MPGIIHHQERLSRLRVSRVQTRIREYDGDTPQLVREITAFSWDDRA